MEQAGAAGAGAQRQKDALLESPQAGGVRAGLWASRRPTRKASQVRRAAKAKLRPLGPLAGARARASYAAHDLRAEGVRPCGE